LPLLPRIDQAGVDSVADRERETYGHDSGEDTCERRDKSAGKRLTDRSALSGRPIEHGRIHFPNAGRDRQRHRHHHCRTKASGRNCRIYRLDDVGHNLQRRDGFVCRHDPEFHQSIAHG
jgi:hypothetical protein